MSRIMQQRTPSFHSFVLGFMQPKSSSDVTALGSTMSQIVKYSFPEFDLERFFQIADLALPGFPIKKQE